MASEERRRIKTFVGATARKLRFQLRDPDTGAIVDATPVTAAYVSAQNGDTFQISSAVLTIEVGTDGWMYFYPTAPEVAAAGDLVANIRLEYTGDLDYGDTMIIEVATPVDAAI